MLSFPLFFGEILISFEDKDKIDPLIGGSVIFLFVIVFLLFLLFCKSVVSEAFFLNNLDFPLGQGNKLNVESGSVPSAKVNSPSK